MTPSAYFFIFFLNRGVKFLPFLSSLFDLLSLAGKSLLISVRPSDIRRHEQSIRTRTTETHSSGCDKLYTSTNSHNCLRDILFTKHNKIQVSGSNTPELYLYAIHKVSLQLEKLKTDATEISCVTSDNKMISFNGS